MRGTLYLLAGLLCTCEGIYHIATSAGLPGSFLGMKIPFMPYVTFEIGIGIFFLYNYYLERSNKLKG